MSKPTLHLIGGPTASGKTALALDLAQRENGVVINADSMQIYAGLPILTAQPTAEEKDQAPHELFEIYNPGERGSVGKWLELAQNSIERTLNKGQTPIIVGGTGLYFAALLGGLADIPPIPENVRKSVIDLYDAQGHDVFRAELSKFDPISATRIKPNDRQRLIRAYEVATHTKRTLGEWQRDSQSKARELEDRFTTHRHLLLPSRDTLYAACDARFLKMMDRGALEEVRALMTRELAPDLPAMKILGVRELMAHLRGEMTLHEAIARAQQATRNYAKRQVTWFKNQWT